MINNSEYYTQEEKRQAENNISNIDFILFASSNNITDSIIISIFPVIMLNNIEELLQLTQTDIKDNYDKIKSYF